ncbi:hypothetical protein Nepgr_019142 [Nepenthes gracilis]|uniref:DYW domain-containing protein n=1 Tax=Nepenthes gracilis TaxID=150966 RepID=A0AAD3SWE9_NEPGR|nr:hypothetical protein Nepgr_019142 [Nepenthes gracilis]
MDKVISFKCFTTPSSQNSFISKLPTNTVHSLASQAVTFADTSQVSPLPLSLCSSYSQVSPHFDLFSEPSKLKSLDSVKQMHAHMIKLPERRKADTNIVMNLMISYLKFSDCRSAVMLFFLGSVRNFLVWKIFLEEYKRCKRDPYEILEVFGGLQYKGVEFDCRILTAVLKLCSILMNAWLGVELHACLIKRGFHLDVHLRCALMNFYGNCWGTEYADEVLAEMPEREVPLWNEAIMVNLQNGSPMKALELFRDMQHSFVKADNVKVAKALQACGKVDAIDEGKQIHGYVFRNSMNNDLPVCNSLITIYSKNNQIELAKRVFNSMENLNLSSWNAMLSGYAALGCFDDAWKLFYEMGSHGLTADIVTWNCLLSSHFQHGLYQQVLMILYDMQVAKVKPNSRSITPVVQAVTELSLMNLGREIHCYVVRNGLDYDEYVGTTLLDMYVKTNSLDKAQAVFDLMKNKNIVAWNSLISGYSSKGRYDNALNLLNQMDQGGFKPDIVTWNALVSGYSLNGQLKDSLAIIHQMKLSSLTPNVISWTALVSGCSKCGNYKDSIKFFNQMMQEDVKPNSATLSSLLQACAGLSLLLKGKEIHCFCVRNGFSEEVIVGTALIDMYVKSGNLKYACEVFWRMKRKTVATWNCMIMGFAIYSQGKEAAMLFDQMPEVGMQPDVITFTAVLSGCKNSGLLDLGWKYFDIMKAIYGITPTIEHYSCMVDLLGRTGYVDEALDLIQTMPMKPDASIWGALLGSCRIHNNLELGKIAASNLFELEPYNSANYMMMMNLYSMSNRWDDVDNLKDQAIARGVKVKKVWSWLQINLKVHIFSVEEPHPDSAEIYFELYQLISEMKKVGYVPNIKCVYQNIDDVEKKKVLLSHTEKLAITYGLIKSTNSSPIRVIKNARICSDCHMLAKFVSLVRNHEILLKDGVRFHHFREGKCSCNDCW